MITRIRRINLGVSDLSGALRFFAAGMCLPLSREIALRGFPHSWEMAPGGPALAIREQTPGLSDTQPGTVTIDFETDDMQTDYAALQAQGVEFAGPPVEVEWEGTVASFAGPDGVRLRLVQAQERK